MRPNHAIQVRELQEKRVKLSTRLNNVLSKQPTELEGHESGKEGSDSESDGGEDYIQVYFAE